MSGVTRVRDEQGFAALYRDHVALVAHIASQRLNDQDAVADVVQEVFFRALRALPTLRDQDAFGAWVAAITRHVVADVGRRPHDAPLVIDLESHEPGPEEHAEVMLALDEVRTGRTHLSARDTQIIDLLVNGMGPTEVGLALHISPGAAKVAIHRARLRLRAEIDRRGGRIVSEDVGGVTVGNGSHGVGNHGASP